MRRVTSLGWFGALGSASLVLATGCVDQAYMPSVQVARAGAAESHVVVAVPAREDVVKQWQLPTTSPWIPYEKATLLSALTVTPEAVTLPKIEDLADVRSAYAAGLRVGAAGVPASTLWIVDLRGAASVAFAAGLSRASTRPIAAVPLFNNWPSENELVPAEETLAAMVAYPPANQSVTRPSYSLDPVHSAPVFLLDAWRLAYADEEIDEDVVDNRYMLSEHDFPTAETLQEQGIVNVVYVTEDNESGDIEEDDLNRTFRNWSDGGMILRIADVASLMEASPDRRLVDDETVARPFYPVARVTFVEDPAFYARARGGFGGAHGSFVPSGHAAWGVHWSGGG